MHGRTLLLASVVILWADGLQAQMFSPFQTIQSNPTLRNAEGLSGQRRFLRSNRRRDDFIGRDIDAAQGFVGEARGRTEGRVPPAALTLQEEVVVDVNVPAPAPSAAGIYPPRLSFAFEISSPAESLPARPLHSVLTRALGLPPEVPLEVEMRGRTAMLRGEVASPKQREMAELLALFEPGVESVRNELQVREPPRRPLPVDSPPPRP